MNGIHNLLFFVLWVDDFYFDRDRNGASISLIFNDVISVPYNELMMLAIVTRYECQTRRCRCCCSC